jgi:hypothetical protein
MNDFRVTCGLTSLLIAVSVSGCRDECRPSDAHCDDNVAFICRVEVSDAHSRDNPYVWHERDCTVRSDGAPGICKEHDGAPVCERAPFPDLPTPKPIAWEGPTAALGADRIVLTIGDLVLESPHGTVRGVGDDGIDGGDGMDGDDGGATERRTTLEVQWAQGELTTRALVDFRGDVQRWQLDRITVFVTPSYSEGFTFVPASPLGAPMTQWLEVADVTMTASPGAGDSSGPYPEATLAFEGLVLRGFW